MLDPIYNAIGWLLAAFYSVIPNLGVAIIFLTVTIMLILYPLTAKQAKSMIAMQRLQPEIKRLQAKYKGDRQKMNEEVMKVYQENKVNPLAGCLPLVVQLPIFFSLFHVLRDSYKYVPKSSDLYQALCGGFGKFCGSDLTGKIAEELGAPAVSGFAKGEQLVHHLTFLGMDLQKSATDVSGGVLDATPYFILVLLVMVTGFMQTRQAQKRTPQANKQMATVMKVLPVFFGLISLQFPSGLVLYFFVSNLWRLGQQEVIFRRHGSAVVPAGGKAVIEAKSKERPAAAGPEEIEAPEVIEAPAAEKQKASTRPASPSRPAPTGRKGGGLRGLLSVPPPAANGGGSNGGSGGAAQRSSGTSASRSTPPKPPPQRKRKKKRKR